MNVDRFIDMKSTIRPGYVAAADHCAHVEDYRMIRAPCSCGCGTLQHFCPLCGANEPLRKVIRAREDRINAGRRMHKWLKKLECFMRAKMMLRGNADGEEKNSA